MPEIEYAIPLDVTTASGGRVSARTARRKAAEWGGIRATRRWLIPIKQLAAVFSPDFAEAVRQAAAARVAGERRP